MAQPNEIRPLQPAKKHSYSKGIRHSGLVRYIPLILSRQRVGTFSQLQLDGCTPRLPPGISSHGTRQSPHLPTRPYSPEAAESFSALLRHTHRQLLTTLKRWLFCLEAFFFFSLPFLATLRHHHGLGHERKPENIKEHTEHS